MQATINAQSIELQFIPAGKSLTPRERWALEALDSALRNDPQFMAQFPNAKLERVDSNRSLGEANSGRFYLRYSSEKGMGEFWGHVAKRSHLDLKRGIIGLPVTPNTPAPSAELANS